MTLGRLILLRRDAAEPGQRTIWCVPGREIRYVLVEKAHAAFGEAPRRGSGRAFTQLGGAVAPNSAQVRPA